MAQEMAVKGRPAYLERHYLPAELAEIWHVHPDTVRAWCDTEPGVLRIGDPSLKKGRKRAGRVEMRIPESTAKRVWEKRTGTKWTK